MTLETLFLRPVRWKRDVANRYLFHAELDGCEFTLRLNDFPEEPLCTLVGLGEEMDLEAFGEHWALPWHQSEGDETGNNSGQTPS